MIRTLKTRSSVANPAGGTTWTWMETFEFSNEFDRDAYEKVQKDLREDLVATFKFDRLMHGKRKYSVVVHTKRGGETIG
jgi:hypothetical protein